MARGEDEKSCFEYIKHQLFEEKAFSCSYEAYCEDRIMLSKRPMKNLIKPILPNKIIFIRK